jgi:hypothetical protein
MIQSVRKIGGNAAHGVADRLESGPLTAPVAERASRQRIEYTEDGSRDPTAAGFTVAALADRDPRDAGWTWTLLTGARDWSDNRTVWGGWGSAGLCWPAVLPQHRDVIAAHLVSSMAGLADTNDRAEVLPLLAEADGSVGHGMTLALGYGLAAKSTAARTDAVDALLILAGRHQLDGAALGRELGHLIVQHAITTSRLINPLRDAAQAGAARETQAALVAMLELILGANEPAPAGLADLLALTAEIVEFTRHPAEIAGLAEFTARRGSSRQLVESRRLHSLVGSFNRTTST